MDVQTNLTDAKFSPFKVRQPRVEKQISRGGRVMSLIKQISPSVFQQAVDQGIEGEDSDDNISEDDKDDESGDSCHEGLQNQIEKLTDSVGQCVILVHCLTEMIRSVTANLVRNCKEASQMIEQVGSRFKALRDSRDFNSERIIGSSALSVQIRDVQIRDWMNKIVDRMFKCYLPMLSQALREEIQRVAVGLAKEGIFEPTQIVHRVGERLKAVQWPGLANSLTFQEAFTAAEAHSVQGSTADESHFVQGSTAGESMQNDVFVKESMDFLIKNVLDRLTVLVTQMKGSILEAGVRKWVDQLSMSTAGKLASYINTALRADLEDAFNRDSQLGELNKLMEECLNSLNESILEDLVFRPAKKLLPAGRPSPRPTPLTTSPTTSP